MSNQKQQGKKRSGGYYSPYQVRLEQLQKLRANIAGAPHNYSVTEGSNQSRHNFTKTITACQKIQQSLHKKEKTDGNQSTVANSKDLTQNSSFKTLNCSWEEVKETKIVKVDMLGSSAMNEVEVATLNNFFDRDEIAVVLTSVVETDDLTNFQFEEMVSKLMTSTTDATRIYKKNHNNQYDETETVGMSVKDASELMTGSLENKGGTKRVQLTNEECREFHLSEQRYVSPYCMIL